MQAYVLFALVAVAIGGVAWVFVYPILSGERAAERRKASVARSEPVAARQTRGAQKSRREQVEGTLKEMDQRQRRKAKRALLAVRITQAGLSWSKRRFIWTAAALGVGAFVMALPPAAACRCGCCLYSRSGGKRAFSQVSPTPSTSSFAASRPACRCSTISR